MTTSPSERLPEGVLGVETLGYRGKRYELPIFDAASPVVLTPHPLSGEAKEALRVASEGSLVVRDLHSVFDARHFAEARRPRDPSLSVFPWQDLDGKPLPAGAPKTSPRLRRA